MSTRARTFRAVDIGARSWHEQRTDSRPRGWDDAAVPPSGMLPAVPHAAEATVPPPSRHTCLHPRRCLHGRACNAPSPLLARCAVLLRDPSSRRGGGRRCRRWRVPATSCPQDMYVAHLARNVTAFCHRYSPCLAVARFQRCRGTREAGVHAARWPRIATDCRGRHDSIFFCSRGRAPLSPPMRTMPSSAHSGALRNKATTGRVAGAA